MSKPNLNLRLLLVSSIIVIIVLLAGRVQKPGDIKLTPVPTITLSQSSKELSEKVIVEIPSSIKLKNLEIYKIDGKIYVPNDLYIKSYPYDTDGYYIVQFVGPIYEEYKTRVTNLGGKLFDYLPDNAFIVKMNESTKNKVQSLDVVQWVGIYQPAYKISYNLFNETGNITLTIGVFDGGNISEISRKVQSLGGMILAASTDKIRILIDTSKISDIANIKDVKYIEKYVTPKTVD